MAAAQLCGAAYFWIRFRRIHTISR